MTQMLIPEPTNNIAPKVPGKKYEGGEIVSAVNGSSIYLLCQVVDYPTLYKYISHFSS